jgi:hypothetical protein
MPVRLLWSQTVGSSLRGLSAARERGWLLVWDNQQNLTLLNQSGHLQAQARAPCDVVAASAADDGRSFVAVGREGQVYLLAPDLTPRWQRSITGRATALALDSFAQRIAVADAEGGVHLLDEAGNLLWRADNPRPLQFLSFVPEKPAVVGSADFGLVVCFDAVGRCLWRDGLVAHIGSLATSGDGETIALACFSEGACCYGVAEGPKARRMVGAVAPCRLLACSYTGHLWLTVGLEPRLTLRDPDGVVRAETAVEGRPVAIALDPTGKVAAVAMKEGPLMAFEVAST